MRVEDGEGFNAVPVSFSLLFFFFFGKDCVQQGRGRKRGREKFPSRLHAVSAQPEAGLILTNPGLMT